MAYDDDEVALACGDGVREEGTFHMLKERRAGACP